MTIGAAGALLTLVASLPAVVAGLALVSTAVGIVIGVATARYVPIAGEPMSEDESESD